MSLRSNFIGSRMNMLAALAQSNRPGSLLQTFPLACSQMARFRNLLVHVYWKIDYGQIYDIIATRLDDLRSFRTTMVGLI